MIITIDGGVASGKSAVGRRVAEALGLPFIDSGLMYRAITKLAGDRQLDPRDSEAVARLAGSVKLQVEADRVWADGVELTHGIYDADDMEALPLISAIPAVRESLVRQQREMAGHGVVMAGRDIGTVVFPDADHKFFLTASLEEKVRRRAVQYGRRGENADREAMRREVEARDRIDTQRKVAPLRAAPDAVVIDTDDRDVDQVVDLIVKQVRGAATAVMYRAMRMLMRFLTNTYLLGLFKVIGAENVPRSGPLIICPNHSANLDPPLVPAFAPRDDTWNMAKSDYFRGGFLKWVFTSYQAFPVVRHSADRNALRRSFDLLKAGQVLIMYPEGTRVESGVLATPEPGAGFMAQKAACPVVPVGLTGTRECLPKGSRWPRRVPVTITFGKPFIVREKREDGTRIPREEAADAIMLAIAELLPEHQRGAFSDLPALRERLAGATRPAS